VAEKIENGMLRVRSHYSVPDTLKRVESLLQQRGLTISCRIDHSGEAEKVGLKMQPTQLILFGSPKAGTPVMVTSPTIAIDLPLKALVWRDTEGKVWLSRNSSEYLRQRHNVPKELVQKISSAEALLQAALE
jgi:uncharacterized protein (DUF302 family)